MNGLLTSQRERQQSRNNVIKALLSTMYRGPRRGVGTTASLRQTLVVLEEDPQTARLNTNQSTASLAAGTKSALALDISTVEVNFEEEGQEPMQPGNGDKDYERPRLVHLSVALRCQSVTGKVVAGRGLHRRRGCSYR